MTLEFEPQLVDEVYEELKIIAGRTLRGFHARQSLNATDVVHEAWLRMQDQKCYAELGRRAFLTMGAVTIRRVLLDYVRKGRAEKRGGNAHRVPLFDSVALETGPSIDLLALNDALEQLAVHHPREAQAVELRFFGGLTHKEIAEALGVSLGTINADWNFARPWLALKLGEGAQ